MALPTCLASESCGLWSRVPTLTELGSAIGPNNVSMMSRLQPRSLPLWPRFVEPCSGAARVTWVSCHVGSMSHVVRVLDTLCLWGILKQGNHRRSGC